MSEQAYEGEITLNFNYKATENSAVEQIKIESERIGYVMIEQLYENERILPVIYISVNLKSEVYTKVTNARDTSEFHLKIRKRNALSKTAVYEEYLNDTFSYVTPNTSANYSESLNQTTTAQDAAYRGLIIGLVSSKMTNQLRQSYNGIYKNITMSNLVNKLALGGMKNIIMPPIKYDKTFENILIPPMSSRYRLLNYLFHRYAFWDSHFTFFMDFKKTYLIPRNGDAVSANDGKPDNVLIEIMNYTAKEAYTDGFEVKNGAYRVYVNAVDTNVIINTSTDKVTNNLIAYSDLTGRQNLSVTTNPNEKNETKTNYVRSNSAAAIKNELQSNAVMVQMLKQHLDPAIFTPNKAFNVKHYKDYSQYDGKYYLSYKREFYYLKGGNKFIISCNVGLKQAVNEEIARTETDTYSPSVIKNSRSSKKQSTANKTLSSSKATRRK